MLCKDRTVGFISGILSLSLSRVTTVDPDSVVPLDRKLWFFH